MIWARIAETVHKDGLPDVLCLQEISRNYPSTDEGADQVKELENLFPDYELFSEHFMTDQGEKKKPANNSELSFNRLSPVQVLHHLLPSPAKPKRQDSCPGR
ncbi:MAG: hypothetical protein CM1200mP30_12580 [Pseudomonadota bacterium]|nr:MAG: hypothetical protein CM1200mP30_12580 [Pseudomonadota bacterium]